jgi:hypothetical protein
MIRSRWARYTLLFLVIGPLAILVFGGVVMLLWNNVLAEVLKISTITFWQALGLLVLSKILFGSFGGGRSSHGESSWKRRMREKWARMTPEERERFKEKWRNGKWGYKPWDSPDSGTQTSTEAG